MVVWQRIKIERAIDLYNMIDKMIYSKPDEQIDCDVKRDATIEEH